MLHRTLEIIRRFKFRYSITIVLLLCYMYILNYPTWSGVLSPVRVEMLKDGLKTLENLLNIALGYYFASKQISDVTHENKP
jgi:hypothetical protein